MVATNLIINQPLNKRAKQESFHKQSVTNVTTGGAGGVRPECNIFPLFLNEGFPNIKT